MKSSFITAILAILILWIFTGCTVTTAPDGRQTRSPDYNAWFEITRLILADEVPAISITPTK